mmetsp:Transcript_62988/g.136754  ORF Transcript_62988/g.136754 Transcript_62988/m.136754 type:complete len:640 (-) Transcript_62988:160-2079(-)
MDSSIGGLIGAFKEVPFAAFTQEILVLTVFLVSFIIWRQRVGQRARRNASEKDLALRDPGVVHSELPLRKASSGNLHNGEVKLGRQRPSTVPTSDAALPSVRAAEQQMLRHLDQREFTRALNLYRALERDGRDRFFQEELFSSFIQSAIRVGKVDVVERMLRTMKRNKLMPSFQFWQTTLKMLSSRKHFSVCLSVHTLFGHKIPPDKVVFSCLINAALEVGAADRAAAMLERYSDAGLEAKDYVLFFRTYVSTGDVDAAEAIFRRLGKEVTTLMLNLLLLTCVNAKEPHRALGIMKEAHGLEKGLEERIVDVVSYNTVIKGFAQANLPSQCFDCLYEMLSQGLEPDDITFGTLLDACILDHDMGAAHEIVSLLMGRDRPMDTVMCTLFIKGLVRANCLPKALELYEEMKARDGARPDIVTYSVLIKALVDQHALERALQLLEDMTKAGQNPDDIILTHLLEGCRHASNHELGKRLFSEMLAAGVKPSEFTLITMLKLHGRCGAHLEAYELVQSWEQQHGTRPSVIHYTCIMSGCLRTKNYDQAWAAYELMCEHNVSLDETAVSTLLPALIAAHHWDRALTLARRAFKASTPINIPAETLNNALSQMLVSGGLGRHAEQLQALMHEAGVPVTTRNARRLA